MRYLPLEDADRREMLAKVGVKSVDELFAAVPNAKLLKSLPDLPKAKGELEVERELGRLAARNTAAGSVPFFIGAGAYRHHVPASVDHLIQRSEFLTSYTPYQPEITQGTLQYLFEFQTQVAHLTAMDVANASMYDGSTGSAEAVLMAHRVTRRKKAVVSGGLHPQYADVIATLSKYGSAHVDRLPATPQGVEDIIARIDGETSCVVRAIPGLLRPRARSAADRRRRSRQRRAAGGGRDRGGRARRAEGARRDGRRHRGGRGAVDRQRLELRRPLCRAVRDQGQVRAPDAGPAHRRDGRCGGPARFRADAVDARAAYPPREGDEQHLHQLRAVRAGVHDPHDAAWARPA